ncbi:hypothetical protein OSTOST_22041, partial [Ostertagia ostertagi]
MKNYRPIALLSQLYKLFTKIILNRLERQLDDYQPVEQAGFRKGFCCMDHIHTVTQLIERAKEYKYPHQPVCVSPRLLQLKAQCIRH